MLQQTAHPNANAMEQLSTGANKWATQTHFFNDFMNICKTGDRKTWFWEIQKNTIDGKKKKKSAK